MADVRSTGAGIKCLYSNAFIHYFILSGIADSDSFGVDPHKCLFQPYGCGAIVVRDGARLHGMLQQDGFCVGERKAGEFDAMSPSSFTFELSRPFRALPIWFSLNLMGLDTMKRALEEKLALARYLYTEMRHIKGIVLGPRPDLTTVIFR